MDLLSMSRLFEQFLAQRRYLKNVTSSTIEWYETAFKALQRTHGMDPVLSKPALQAFVVALRKRAVKPISCNTYIKALNAFCRWLHEEGHLAQRLELPVFKVEKRILQTLSDEQIRSLLSWKPKTFDQWRLSTLIALTLDTGVRIEALTLRTRDCYRRARSADFSDPSDADPLTKASLLTLERYQIVSRAVVKRMTADARAVSVRDRVLSPSVRPISRVGMPNNVPPGGCVSHQRAGLPLGRPA
jgi:site-specific recombinase XerD